MRMVDALLRADDSGALVQGRIAPDCPFVDAAGFLSAAGLLEMAAQSCACLQGLAVAQADGQAGGKPREAFLVGLKNFVHDAPARKEDALFITVTPAAELDGFFLADARITRGAPDGPQVASVRIKAYCPPESGAEPHAPA